MSKIIGIHVPSNPRNNIINGALDFWQRVGGNNTTINSASSTGYLADRVLYNVTGGTTRNFSIVRSTNVPTLAQSGFQSNYSYLISVITGNSTFGATDTSQPYVMKIEGQDYEKLHSKTVTLSFWLNASLPGTYSVAFRNSAQNRSYVTTVTQNAGNTWELKVLTITLDNTGTWLFDNTVGLSVEVASYTGTTYQTSSLNQWQAGNFVSASTATNYMATTGATIAVAQMSLIEGSLFQGFQRAGLDIQGELAKCQRYCEYIVSGTSFGSGMAVSGTLAQCPVIFQVAKRANPTVSTGPANTVRYNNGSNNYSAGSISLGNVTPYSAGLSLTSLSSTPVGNVPGLFDIIGAGFLSFEAEL